MSTKRLESTGRQSLMDTEEKNFLGISFILRLFVRYVKLPTRPLCETPISSLGCFMRVVRISTLFPVLILDSSEKWSDTSAALTDFDFMHHECSCQVVSARIMCNF